MSKSFGAEEVTNGRTHKNRVHKVYFGDAKTSIGFVDTNPLPQTRAKACGTQAPCVALARLTPQDEYFNYSNETEHKGTGMPYSGLQPFGHADGPSHSGRPA